MIVNRPAYLETIPYYKHLPKKAFAFDFSSLPEILNLDIYELDGLLPITKDISDLCPNGIFVQPSKAEIDYYSQQNIKFQMIFVVANIYGLKEKDDVLVGKPYNISLIPASKRGKPEEADPKFISLLRLEELPERGLMYLGFDPFVGQYGFFGNARTFFGASKEGLNFYTDSIGCVIGMYFLANHFKKQDVLLSNMVSADKIIRRAYHKYRVQRYYTPFTDVRPRKLWGADSPIELFLIQALAHEGLFPEIQTLVFNDGSVYPNFYEMVSALDLKKGKHLITEVDLYFKQERLAVFCDSNLYHSSEEAKAKDESIVDKLASLGISSLRLNGADIVNDLPDCVRQVKEALRKSERRA